MCCTRDLVAGMATCGTRRGSAGGPVVHDEPAFLVTITHDGVSDPTGVFTRRDATAPALPRKIPPKGGPFEGSGTVRRNGRSHRSGQTNAVVVSSWSAHGQQTRSMRSACCLHMDNTWSAHGLHAVSTWPACSHPVACIRSVRGQHTASMRPHAVSTPEN